MVENLVCVWLLSARWMYKQKCFDSTKSDPLSALTSFFEQETANPIRSDSSESFC